MSDRITIIPQPIAPPPQSHGRKQQGTVSGSGSFDQLLQNKIEQGR